MNITAKIHVTGIVQGVGFRPFVYRHAQRLGLSGYVLNLGDAGVRIVVEGDRNKIETLIDELQNRPPSISRIETLDVEWTKYKGRFDGFHIEKSSDTKGGETAPEIPPDIAICEECIEDLTSTESRWYQYAFTSCAACGPRYSTITDLPYDRPNTTMVDFPLCNTCNSGYTDPINRRYHAQTTACAKCGPIYWLSDGRRKIAERHSAVKKVAELIADGKILAIQGISGTHLVTKTTDPKPIMELRKRKKRLQRPFAIMVRDIKTLKKFTRPTNEEINYLSSWRRPIVLIPKRDATDVIDVLPPSSLESIAPGLDTVGVMIPYAPLHYLLFDQIDEPALVMTSANPTAVPMYIRPSKITDQLSDIADYFLLHNRRIHQREDDTVVKFLTDDKPVFIRRARGYVPEPITLTENTGSGNVIAVGPEEKATGAVLKSDSILMTQHIGDTDRVESIQFLDNAIRHLMFLLGMEHVDTIASDLHPEFLSTEYAENLSQEFDAEIVHVQHHHAHLAALMVDNQISCKKNITCITADGFGFGADENAWGGEILVGDCREFDRSGGIEPIKYVGGDMTARFAARPVVGLLADYYDTDEIMEIVGNVRIAPGTNVSNKSMAMLIDATKKGVGTIDSSSVGRFLDATSAVLGICSENTYDGECPMKLEASSRETDLRLSPTFISRDELELLDISDSLKQVVELKSEGYSITAIAYAAQWHVGEALADIACRTAESENTKYVGFSGGVALNRIITKAVLETIRANGLKPLVHKRIPPGDGGISAGQAVIAAHH